MKSNSITFDQVLQEKISTLDQATKEVIYKNKSAKKPKKNCVSYSLDDVRSYTKFLERTIENISEYPELLAHYTEELRKELR